VKLMTAQEVGELLGRKTNWVLNQAATGEIPSFKLGHAVRFREDEIVAWLESKRRGTLPGSRSLRAVGGKL